MKSEISLQCSENTSAQSASQAVQEAPAGPDKRRYPWRHRIKPQ